MPPVQEDRGFHQTELSKRNFEADVSRRAWRRERIEKSKVMFVFLNLLRVRLSATSRSGQKRHPRAKVNLLSDRSVRRVSFAAIDPAAISKSLRRRLRAA